jgi:Na+/proline symporter
MRISRAATIFWGVAQIAVAIGAQYMPGSILQAGLAVLSLAAGPVLGAFLLGVLTTRIGTNAMLTGMLVGVAGLFWVWWTGATAWTWYALIGSSLTAASAALASLVFDARSPAPAR